MAWWIVGVVAVMFVVVWGLQRMQAVDRQLLRLRRKSGLQLASRVAVWSNRTFGDRKARGPEGPLKHMLKELLVEFFGMPKARFDEILKEIEANESRHSLYDVNEYADLQILVADALFRAGLDWESFMGFAHRKQSVNEERRWNTTSKAGIVEHLKPGQT